MACVGGGGRAGDEERGAAGEGGGDGRPNVAGRRGGAAALRDIAQRRLLSVDHERRGCRDDRRRMISSVARYKQVGTVMTGPRSRQ